MDLDVFSWLGESSWPFVLLDVFMSDSIDQVAKSRLENIFEFQDFIMRVENDLSANGSYDNKNEYAEINSECNEFVNNDGASYEYQDEY